VVGVFAKGETNGDQPTTDIAVQEISFSRSDTEALNIARRMYGRDFAYVKAVRVWLEAPNEDPEQLLLKVGRDRNCLSECFNLALFYNQQWLEIYRRPATDTLGLSAVSPTGLRSIIEDGRVWAWNTKAYIPQPDLAGMRKRSAAEKELETVSQVLGANIDEITATSFGPPEVDAYSVDLRSGKEKILVVRSPYFCGQSSCPVLLLDGDGQPIRILNSLEGVVGVSRSLRDEQGYRGVEILSRDGVIVVSPTSGEILETIQVQAISVAGSVR
jgi:hypothetical protein